MALKKLSIALDEEIIRKLDAYAKEIGVTRNAAMSFIFHTHFKQEQAMNTLERIKELTSTNIE